MGVSLTGMKEHSVVWSSIEDCDSLAWQKLWELSGSRSVFQRYEWIRAWWESVSQPHWRLMVFGLYRGEDLAGIAPLYCAAGDRLERADLEFAGHPYSDYQSFVVKDGDIRAIRSLLKMVVDTVAPNGKLILNEIVQFSELSLVLGEADTSRSIVSSYRWSTPCPRLAVRENDEGVRAVLNKQSLRRRRKRLSNRGTMRVQHYTDPETISRHLPAFFAQHIARWRATKFPSLFENSINRHFYERLTSELGRLGDIVFSSLSLSDRQVAFHFGFRSSDDLLWYKPSFDIGLADCAPGEVLLGHLIEYAADQGYAALDFTRGNEPFKSRFASQVDYNVSYLVSGPTWCARRGRLRSFLHDMLWRGRRPSDDSTVILGGAAI